jgi:hypothetical protein
MQTEEFKQWRLENPLIEELFFYPEGKDFRYGRIAAKWVERKEEKDLTHICAFAFDFYNGDILEDCRKRKIWIKCLLLNMGYPLAGFNKTLYHALLPLSIPVEIFKGVQEGIQHNDAPKQIAAKVLRNMARNIADIIRTPLYTIALTIVTLSATIIGIFAPRKLYQLRALAGRIELTLNWGDKESPWILANCFQPIFNIQEIHLHFDKNNGDTFYEIDNPNRRSLNNLARAYVNYWRRNRNPFNNYFRLLNDQTPYISAAF